MPAGAAVDVAGGEAAFLRGQQHIDPDDLGRLAGSAQRRSGGVAPRATKIIAACAGGFCAKWLFSLETSGGAGVAGGFSPGRASNDNRGFSTFEEALP